MSSTMEKEESLDKKINRLCRAAGYPRWFNHMDPKRFKIWVFCLGLVVKQVYQLSYRRTKRFLEEYYKISLHWTTLQKAAKKLPKHLWQSLLAATINVESVPLAAADGTGFARSGPSHYFLKRIDRKGPIGRPVQAITMVDVEQRKFIAGTFLSKPAGEAKKIPTIYKQTPIKPDVLVLDKGFDAEWLHKWLNQNGTFSIIPVRKNCRRGKFRKLMKNCMDYYIYWQRNIIESLYSALKRLFGNTVKSRHIKTQTAELFCRLIAYNLEVHR